MTAISPLEILPIFALSARSFSFPAASYIAKSVPLTHIGFGLAVFTIASAFTFVISLRTILNGIVAPPYA